MNRNRHTFGLTLVEVVVTVAVLAVVSLGAVGYQFHAVKRAKVGHTKMAAARLGSLILESWKNYGGSAYYDPTDLNLGVIDLESSDHYLMVVDEIPFYFRMIAEDVDSDETTGVTLRRLCVMVQWRRDYAQQMPTGSDPAASFYTYVRQDQSGG